MAIAERHLAAEFGSDIVDHHTYVLASDGDLMEGISQEAIALAGHLKLNRLIVLFDDNGISIDGPLSLADSVDQVKRFEAAGWAASRIDGHDPDAIAAAIDKAKTLRPALADRLPHHHRLRRADQGRQVEKRHGSPLGADEIKGAREKLGWTEPAVRDPGRRARAVARGRRSARKPLRAAWKQRLDALRRRAARRIRAPHARRTAEGQARRARCAPSRRSSPPTPKEIATRIASESALEALTAARAGDDRRLGRPHRLQQHPRQGA